MTKHLDITHLFSDLQYGFRAFRSTADILNALSECIYNLLDVGGEMRAIALDISNAFNKVWHAGVVGPIPSILESFLQQRSLKVVIDGQSSPLISPMLEFLRIYFGASLISGFYWWSSRRGSIKNRDLCKWHHTQFQVGLAGELGLDLRSIVEWQCH